jgi:hypothetical protein
MRRRVWIALETHAEAEARRLAENVRHRLVHLFGAVSDETASFRRWLAGAASA